MKIEYLLFNLIVLAGPLIMSFERQIRFVRFWPAALLAAVLAGIPYIIWDHLVTGRHWDFNEQYILGPRIWSLPIEEWLFFLTVPFAMLFMLELVKVWKGDEQIEGREISQKIWILLIAPGAFIFSFGFEYSGLVLIAMGVAGFLDFNLGTGLFKQISFGWYLLTILLATFVFNMYLTARPVVIYDDSYRLAPRLVTIPLEDFFYGLSHLVLVGVIYTKLKGWLHRG